MRFLLVLTLPFLLAAGPAAARPELAQAPQLAQRDLAGIVFSEVERRLVHEFYGVAAPGGSYGKIKHKHKGKGRGRGKGKSKGRGKGMPPGLARRGALPPGLQRQLDRKGRLPPGLAKRGLPGNLHGRLPRLPRGVERVIVGDDVLLIQAATGLVLDAIIGVAKSTRHRRK